MSRRHLICCPSLELFKPAPSPTARLSGCVEGNVSSPTMIESPRDTARSARRRASAAMAALAVAFVLWGGYGAHWSWTGINGHTATLWDWLHLLLLPAAFALLPILLKRRRHLTSRQKSFALLGLAVFVLLVVIG